MLVTSYFEIDRLRRQVTNLEQEIISLKAENERLTKLAKIKRKK